MPFPYLFTFIFGLICGSFLNAVIFRLHAHKSFLRGRSFCPRCGRVLEPRDLIPVLSFILLKGRCRSCQKPISWQYPLVELATGISFSLLYFVFSWSWAFIFYLILTAFLVIIFVYDLKYHLILDKVSLPAVFLAFIFSLFLKISPWDLLFGVLIGAGFFFLQYALSRGKWIGGGDIRLGALIGMMLGWQKTLLALFLAYFCGAAVSLVMLALKKKKLKSHLPFGTFLTASTFVSLLWGEAIIRWYLEGNLLGWLE